jgi:hypothetical protein
MPGLAVSLNGRKLAVVSTEAANILSVRVHGDVIGPEFANVDVSGGLYGEGEKSVHLTWVNEQEIAPGDEIEVVFLESASTSHAGKTIEELYPAEDEPMGPWPPLDIAFREIAKQPKVRDGFRFRVVPPTGEPTECRMGPNDHLFGFSVLWNWTRPERARVSLSSSTLDEVERRAGGTDYANFILQFGQAVKLRVDV